MAALSFFKACSKD